MKNKRYKTGQLTSLGTVLDEILPKYRQPQEGLLTAVWAIWEKTVGPQIAANARPAAFKGSLLLIHVASSAWLHHLRFMEKELIAKLNQATVGQPIKSLKFKVGPV